MTISLVALAMEQAVKNVLALHFPVYSDDDETSYCGGEDRVQGDIGCGQDWPCATYRAITDAGVTT